VLQSLEPQTAKPKAEVKIPEPEPVEESPPVMMEEQPDLGEYEEPSFYNGDIELVKVAK